MRRGNGGRVTHNISLQPAESLALLRLAMQRYPSPDGRKPRNGAVSWIVTDLIHERMRSEIGRDWEEVITAESEKEAVAA